MSSYDLASDYIFGVMGHNLDLSVSVKVIDHRWLLDAVLALKANAAVGDGEKVFLIWWNTLGFPRRP